MQIECSDPDSYANKFWARKLNSLRALANIYNKMRLSNLWSGIQWNTCKTEDDRSKLLRFIRNVRRKLNERGEIYKDEKERV